MQGCVRRPTRSTLLPSLLVQLSERCSFPSLSFSSFFLPTLFAMGHDIIPRRYTLSSPSFIDREEERVRERETEGAINFHGPSTLTGPYIFFIHRRKPIHDRRYYIHELILVYIQCDTTAEEKAWDDISLAAVRLIIPSLPLSISLSLD